MDIRLIFYSQRVNRSMMQDRFGGSDRLLSAEWRVADRRLKEDESR